MTANAQKKIQQIKKNLSQQNLSQVAYTYFKKITPIDTGNARNSTTLTGNTINASYPYALRLDRGWSNQAPKGMSNPTIEYLRKYIQQQLAKIGK